MEGVADAASEEVEEDSEIDEEEDALDFEEAVVVLLVFLNLRAAPMVPYCFLLWR